MSIDRNILNKLLKDFDQSIVNELLERGYVTGYSAWRLYDYFKRYVKRVVYEDEELNEHECYIVILEITTNQYFLLLRTNSDVYGYIVASSDKELIDSLMKKFEECSKKR